MAPKAGDANGKQALMMTTADMALKIDPGFLEISKRFHKIIKHLKMLLHELGIN